ncbi:MAG: chemotaxis protein CheW [Candidatus Latescibacteria bacterium]|nr:chemotaxis protein CheW [Candidatus Latescibacterota bacterium]
MNKKLNNHIERCWKQIGIFGDSTCDKLDDVVHCRNCPQYFKAAIRLFDKEIPEGYLEESTSLYANPEETEKPDIISVVVFRLNFEWLALKTKYLQEVTKMLPVHFVPFRTNNVFKGLVNINGVLVPCVSLANIIGLTGENDVQSTLTVYKRMIVVGNDKDRYVFIADEMIGIRRISPHDQKKVPATLSKSATVFSSGIYTIDDKTVGLLQTDSFFSSLKRSLTF